MKQFPTGFLWGAATASHQVEGNTHNDWSEWEKANANRLARASEQSFAWNPHWSKFRTEATDPKNYISGTACDHYTRFREDFDILKELNLNAYRFSIEWSRIEPKEGVFDERELNHYRDMVRELRKRGIEPFVTLWHWTLPVWLAEKGGVLARDFPTLFVRYSEQVIKALGNDVKFWITLNEPDVIISAGYLKGQWPPMKQSLWLTYRAISKLIQAHRAAYGIIKQLSPKAQVGIAKHNVWFEAANNTRWNRLLKWLANILWNFWVLDKISGAQDFIGLNHYNHHRIDGWFNKNENKIQTDFGWEYYPESLYHVTMELKKYDKPIYITENGIADHDDDLRPRFIEESLTTLHRAIQDGAPVRGYLYWSLLDNFEWDKGYWPKFGLAAVDRTTQERTIRNSARLYGQIAKRNAIE